MWAWPRNSQPHVLLLSAAGRLLDGSFFKCMWRSYWFWSLIFRTWISPVSKRPSFSCGGLCSACSAAHSPQRGKDESHNQLGDIMASQTREPQQTTLGSEDLTALSVLSKELDKYFLTCTVSFTLSPFDERVWDGCIFCTKMWINKNKPVGKKIWKSFQTNCENQTLFNNVPSISLSC